MTPRMILRRIRWFPGRLFVRLGIWLLPVGVARRDLMLILARWGLETRVPPEPDWEQFHVVKDDD